MKRFIIILFIFLVYSEFHAQNLSVQNTIFANGHYIPFKYTCDGENINPALIIGDIPFEAKSLAIIMLDSSAAFGVFDHWVVWNVIPKIKIEENSVPGITGWNSRKENKYTGPCPPNGIHEYRFRVYALNTFLSLPDSTNKQGLLKAMQGHILSKGELVGLFERE